MKLQADRIEGTNAISRHSAEGVIVNGQEVRHSVIVAWKGGVREWPVRSFDELDESHFRSVAELEPEVVIFGSGARLRFAKPAVMRPLIEARIGVETMDTAAACRTYNVLLAEGRSVVAALLFETAAQGPG
ncbi:MAG TPA: Mth938-like domain-containing protein [Albitalea sp.]|nr:Mth938-like domain-containing protein [Albitalea sp.]